MANKVLLKKSSISSKVPLTSDLDYGEIALNYTDGKLYFKNSSNLIKSFTFDDSVVTLNGTQTLTNKTLASPTLTGTLTAGGVVGAIGQVLASTGTGVEWITVGGTGTVSSVALSLPSIFTVSGSPITTAGTLSASFATQTANTFLAAPNGTDGAPTMRAIVAADIPTLNQNTTGSAATLTTGRTIALTGDVTYTSGAFNGGANVTGIATLANSGVIAASYGGSTSIPVLTIDAKGRVTSASTSAITVGDGTLTLNTSGIATGSQTFTANQATGATFTVNVPGTNIGQGTRTTTTVPITSSTGTGATLNPASTTLAGVMTADDKTKLDGIESGAQVNVATNLGITGGTTAGPTVTSSTGTNVILPTASATVSGVVTTGNQTWAGVKTFNSTITGSISGNAGTATTLETARTIASTGDVTYTSGSFNGSANVTGTATLATVNANVGSFGSSTAIPVVTVNGKGLITAISTNAVSIPSGAITIIGDVSGSGTTGSSTTLTLATVNNDVGTWNTVTVNGKGLVTAGSNAAYLTSVTPSNFASQTANTILAAPNGTAGTPTFRTLVAADVPTLNQNTTGSAATLTTSRNINGVAFNGSANITITAANPNALTIGTGLSGTSYTGSSAVTIAIDSTVVTLTGVQTLTNKSLAAFDQKTGTTTVANQNVTQSSIATVAQTSIDNFAAGTYRSAKYVVQITQGSSYQVSEIMVLHNGTSTTMTEYGILTSNGTLVSFATDISTGNVRLLATMNSATAATINITRTTMVV